MILSTTIAWPRSSLASAATTSIGESCLYSPRALRRPIFPESAGAHARQELEEVWTVDEACAEPHPGQVAMVEDVLTAGAHFVAAKRVLRERFPGVEVIGVVYARRVLPESLTPTATDDLSL
jgi:hypothetical protein